MSINRDFKALISVSAFIVAIWFGINYMVTEEKNDNWLLWFFIFLGLGIFFWWLVWNEDRKPTTAIQSSDAPDLPETKPSENAEAVADNLSSVAEAVAETANTVMEKAQEAIETVAEAAREKIEETAQEIEAEAEAFTEQQDQPAEVVEEAKEEVETVAEEVQEEKASEETEIDDDLRRIEGIGPKYADALIAGGINTFAELAALSVEEIENIAKVAGMNRRKSMATWAEQAALAAEGKWDELDKLQEELSSGRR